MYYANFPNVDQQWSPMAVQDKQRSVWTVYKKEHKIGVHIYIYIVWNVTTIGKRYILKEKDPYWYIDYLLSIHSQDFKYKCL